jgi:hypothetical protein
MRTGEDQMSAQRVTNIEDIRRLPKGTSSVQGINLQDPEVLALCSIKSLRKVDLSGCDLLTDRSVARLLELTELEDVDLTLCVLISDESVEALAQLHKLRRLSLHACYNITDAGLAALAESASLEELILWSCEKVTDLGVESVATVATLRQLELPGFAPITDIGLRALSSNASNLEMLRLDNLSAISDEGLGSLAKLKSLARLVVQGCRQISEAAITALRAALPSCEIIFTS